MLLNCNKNNSFTYLAKPSCKFVFRLFPTWHSLKLICFYVFWDVMGNSSLLGSMCLLLETHNTDRVATDEILYHPLTLSLYDCSFLFLSVCFYLISRKFLSIIKLVARYLCICLAHSQSMIVFTNNVICPYYIAFNCRRA